MSSCISVCWILLAEQWFKEALKIFGHIKAWVCNPNFSLSVEYLAANTNVAVGGRVGKCIVEQVVKNNF